MGAIRRYCLSIAALFLLGCPSLVMVAYPDKPVHIIVGSLGGGTDGMARLVAQKLSEKWGQPVLVENKIGASGEIAEDFVAHATPDGYTLLVDASQHTVIAANPKSKPSFDPINGFAPITLIGKLPDALVINPEVLPVKSLKELIELAKSKPGALTFGDAGAGSAPYFGMALLMDQAQINLLHVTYKGTNDALVALLRGEVQMMLGSVSTVAAQTQSGKIYRIISPLV